MLDNGKRGQIKRKGKRKRVVRRSFNEPSVQMDKHIKENRVVEEGDVGRSSGVTVEVTQRRVAECHTQSEELDVGLQRNRLQDVFDHLRVQFFCFRDAFPFSSQFDVPKQKPKREREGEGKKDKRLSRLTSERVEWLTQRVEDVMGTYLS